MIIVWHDYRITLFAIDYRSTFLQEKQLKQVFKSIIRNFIRKPVTNLINLLGLSVSMTMVIILSIYCYSELTTDSYHINGDRVYLYRKSNEAFYTPAILKDQIDNKIAGLESIVRVAEVWEQPVFQVEDREPIVSDLLFAGCAIVICCLGILAMSLAECNRRVKEIGIRKVNGARPLEIMLMLNRDFIKWVLVAFLLSVPVAFYTMHKWLLSFVYKTEISWWIFIIAGFLAFIIALFTVSWQSWRTATRNPVEALRYE